MIDDRAAHLRRLLPSLLPLRIDHYEERSTGAGSDATAMAILEGASTSIAGTRFAAGQHRDVSTAAVLAVVGLANRLDIDLVPQSGSCGLRQTQACPVD